MAYEARYGGNSAEADDEAKLQRDTQNNAKNIRNAADVAIAAGDPIAKAAGGAVKVADKVTKGKSSEALGKGLAKASQHAPGGQKLQNLSNKAAESGVSDAVGTGARMASGNAGGAASKAGDAANKAENIKQQQENAQRMQNAANQAAANQASNSDKSGGGRGSSLPSSGGSKDRDTSSDDKQDEEKSSGAGSFVGRKALVIAAVSFGPALLMALMIVVIISMITGVFGDYEDAFGMSSTLGEETGDLVFNASSDEQQAFYDRINDVKLSYQAQGKSLDAMKIVAIYHALKTNNVDIEYEDVTTSVIEQWADAMFDGNGYSEEYFRYHLENELFPSYKPGEDQSLYEEMTDEVFDYLDRYYNLIGKENFGSSCASIGNCAYDIKGFSIPGHGNVLKNIQISDLKVRLMECGSPFGNGNDHTPIEQDLVDFEDYVAGVAYAEVGPDANPEVLKAQMVAARSFALARPTAMGNAAGKKLEQENGQWILQIASCVSDQVFCNIDLGCSYMGGGDGQGGICRSGKVAGAARTRDPLPADHQLRQAAAETQGEVLVNSQGYIISTGYLSSDQNSWASLAQSGLNYKQILLQSYNSGSRNYGATDVQKMSCNSTGESSCISTGEFSKWKQNDPQWGSITVGTSGNSMAQIGCLVTSVSMLVAKSGVQTSLNPLNPGTVVQFLNQHGGFEGGNYVWASITQAAPSFKYMGDVGLAGMSRESKLNKIKEIVSQEDVYVVAEVKGNTGQHWVAIDSVTGSTINMMDPASDATDMWAQYNWANTSQINYFRVDKNANNNG